MICTCKPWVTTGHLPDASFYSDKESFLSKYYLGDRRQNMVFAEKTKDVKENAAALPNPQELAFIIGDSRHLTEHREN